jgi:hypothetical protein
MSDQYLLHLPDGTEYGPVDRPTLEAWAREGRLPAETLVWPEGAPEWVALDQALAAAPSPASPEPELVVAPAAEPEPALVALVAPVPAAPVPAAPVPAAPVPAAPVVPVAPAAPAPVPVFASVPAAPASAAPAAPPAAADDDRPDTLPRQRAPRALRPRGPRRAAPEAPRSGGARTAGLALLGIGIVVALLAGLWAVLRPFVAKRRAIAEVQRHALPDRRVEDAEFGLSIELPAGWVALRPDNPYVGDPAARVRLAHPAAAAFGAVSVVARPRYMDDLDAHLAEILRDRVPRQPSMREGARSDVQLGRGQGRLVRTTWEDGLEPMQGATVAWADGYDLFSLEAWARTSAGEAFTKELLELCRGIAPKGTVAARIDEAVGRLAVDVPELSREALRLLVAERLSEGRGLDDVPAAALRMVSRGLDALGAAEAAEMRTIYQQVWAPVPEAERVRLASLMSEIKAGRPVRGEDLVALRTVMQSGVLALPEEQRARLQELSGRAVQKSLLLP